MESSGIPGRIQVTEDVVNLLDDTFVFEKRGPIEVKGKGTMTTYFLVERKQVAHKPHSPGKGESATNSANSETVLFDDNARMTLVETLRKLEDALNASSGQLAYDSNNESP
jgi:hypothetical protein